MLESKAGATSSWLRGQTIGIKALLLRLVPGGHDFEIELHEKLGSCNCLRKVLKEQKVIIDFGYDGVDDEGGDRGGGGVLLKRTARRPTGQEGLAPRRPGHAVMVRGTVAHAFLSG